MAGSPLATFLRHIPLPVVECNSEILAHDLSSTRGLKVRLPSIDGKYLARGALF
jgi:hypothetical protein